MKRIILCLLITTMLISCSKDKNSSNANNVNDSSSIPLGTITADIDGVPTNFSSCYVDTLLGAESNFWSYSILINGSTNYKENGKSIQLWLLKVPADLIGVRNFLAGSYPFIGTTGADTDITTGIYYDTTSMHLYNYDTISKQFIDTFETANFLYSDYGSGYNFPPINITSINDSVIKGTFSSQLMIVVGSSNPKTVNVTNGKFYVPLKH